MPTLKEKKRYILYEIDSMENMANPKNFIFKELRGFVGDLGLAKAGMGSILYKKNKGILQVNHNFVNEIKTGLMLIRKIGNSPVRIRALKVSGVLNKLKVAM